MQNANNWMLEWQAQPIAHLRDGWVPDQFWVHFRISMIKNSLGVTAQTLASPAWWNEHWQKVQYRNLVTRVLMQNIMVSPQSEHALALRGIGWAVSVMNQRQTSNKQSWFSKLVRGER
jgi:hypothetical protein